MKNQESIMTRNESARAAKKKILNLFSRQFKKMKRKINKYNYLKIMQEENSQRLNESQSFSGGAAQQELSRFAGCCC